MKLIVTVLLTPLLYSQTIPTAFRPVPSSSAPTLNEAVGRSRRVRAVEIDSSLFDEKAANVSRTAAADAPHKIVDLNLFDGTSLRVEFDRPEFAGSRSESILWTGRIQNSIRGQVVMAVTGKIHSATISMDSGEKYHIRQANSLVHWVTQGDSSRLPPDGPPKIVPPGEPAAAAMASTVAPTVADDGSTIDVLVVYTPAARLNAGGTTQMANQIALGIAETNQGYANSGVIQRVRLAGSAEVNYSESTDMSVDLDRLTSINDGFMDEVHTLRETFQADAVSLWRTPGNYCGIAWLMNNLTASFATRAFSVVGTNCATGYYSFGHEMGHNMGAVHDVANSGGVAGAYSYSYGFQQKTQAPFFRTVMSYACSAGVTCDRINYWSNPANSYQGITTGTSTSDNRQTLNNTRSISANWRQSGTNSSLSPISATFTSLNGTGSVSVTATGAWTAASNDSWVTITFGAAGSGNGVVNYSVAPNPTSITRTATLTIASRAFTVIQSGSAVPCLVTPLSIPQTAAGTLSTSDCASTQRTDRYAQRFTFNAAAGQQVAITQASSAFDAYISLFSPSGTLLAQDDDSGGGTNARIPASGFYTLPTAGAYTIEATSSSGISVGAFSITLSAPSGCSYSLFQSAASVSYSPGTGSLNVTTGAGCAWTASSSVNWISITSAAAVTGPGTVTYNVSGNSSSASRSGTILVAGLTYAVTQQGLPAACAAVPVTSGNTVNGTISSACTSLNRGVNYFAAQYSFSGTVGQQVAISLNSSSFDSYLYLVGPDGSVAALDDDGGGAPNARIPSSGYFTLPQAGTYTIEATSSPQNVSGAFTLTLAGSGGSTLPYGVSVTPSNGTGAAGVAQNLQMIWASPPGQLPMVTGSVLIQDSALPTPVLTNACYMAAVINGGVQFADDAGNFTQTSYVGNSWTTSPSNGHCTLDGPGSPLMLITNGGANIQAILKLTFNPAWAGKTLSIWMQATNTSYAIGSWQKLGTFTVSGGQPSFTLSATAASASSSVAGTSTVTIASVNVFNSAVTLAASGWPAGITGTFGTNPATSSSAVTINVASTVTPGPYSLTVDGTGGTANASTMIALTVNAPSQFSMAPSNGSAVAGVAQNLQFTWNTPAGQPVLTWGSVVIQDSALAAPALGNACYLRSVVNGGVNLADDAGNFTTPTSYVGNSWTTSPSNGHCTLNGPASFLVSVTNSGANMLTTLNLKFNPSWTGKTLSIWMQATNTNYSSTAWQQVGTFTVN